MRVIFTRLTDDRHGFRIVRADGSEDSRELETRSFLLHDLVHLAVETEAGLKDSFYGRLSRGAAYEAVGGGREIEKTEMVVGALQGALKGEVEPAAFVARMRGHFEQVGGEAPWWLTPEVIAGALRRLRALQGQWRATPFGHAMEMNFVV